MEITIKTAVLSDVVEKLEGMEKELQYFENAFKFSTKELLGEIETLLQKVNNSEYPIVYTSILEKLGKVEISKDVSRVDISDEAIQDFVGIVGKMIPHIMHVTMSYIMATKQAEFFGTEFVKKYKLANQKEEEQKDE